MSTTLSKLLQRVSGTYRKLGDRLDRSMVSGRFWRLPGWQQQKQLARVEKLRLKSERLQLRLKLAAVGGIAAAVAFQTTQASAQGLGPFTEVTDRIKHPLRPALSWSNNLRPYPTLVDLDGDGDIDLFVVMNTDVGLPGALTDYVNFYENKKESLGIDLGLPETTNNPFPGGFTDNGSRQALAFADIDGDGDLDAFVKQNFCAGNSILFLKNVGDPSNPSFVDYTVDPSNPFDGQPIPNGQSLVFVDLDGDLVQDVFVNGSLMTIAAGSFQNYPSHYFETFGVQHLAFIDLDMDGDLDAFSTSGGEFYFFRNDNVNVAPTPFQLNNFSNQSGTEPRFAPFYGSNQGNEVIPRFADYDNDGDLDLFLMRINYYNYSSNSYFVLFENDGNNYFSQAPGLENPFGGLRKRDLNPAWGDIDADGDSDLFFGSYSQGIFHYENNYLGPARQFESRTGAQNPLALVGSPTLSNPALGDVDLDGDLDAFVGSASLLSYHKNDGTAAVPNFLPNDASNTLVVIQENSNHNNDITPVLGDLDADGDLDAGINSDFASGSNMYLAYNDVVGNLSTFTYPGTQFPDVINFRDVFLADLDHDGDADVLVGNERYNDSDLTVYENLGGGSFSQLIGTSNPFGGGLTYVYDQSFPSMVDFDGDGDLDLFMADKYNMRFFMNDNAPPLVLQTVGGLTLMENDPATPVDANLSIADDNAYIVQARFSMGGYVNGEDLLSFTDQLAVSGSWDVVTGIMTLTGSASIADYQTALRSVTYENLSDDPAATKSIGMSIWDSDFTDPSVVPRTVNITPINDPPVGVAGGALLSYTENALPAPIDPGFLVADVDNTNLSNASITIGSNYVQGEDVLGFTNQSGITGSFDAATGTMTLSGSATLADYQTALRSVTYQNSSDAPSAATRTVIVTLNDGTDPSTAVSTDVQVTPVNDAPAISGSTTDLSYRSLTGSTVIDDQISLGDVDDTDLTAATVSVAANFVTGEDVFSFANQNGISGTFNSSTGILFLSGTATVTNYQAALRSVSYSNTLTTPSSALKMISFDVSDASIQSNTFSRNVNVSDNVVTAANINTQVDIGQTITIDVIGQASFLTGDMVTTTITVQPTQGSPVVNTNQTITYTPNSNAGSTDTFTYQLCNQYNSCGTATAIITIVNVPPFFPSLTRNASQGQPFTEDLSILLSDPNGNLDLTTLRIISPPNSGSPVSVDASGNLVVDYSANPSFSGADRMTIEVCDLSGSCTQQEFTIYVGELTKVNVFNAVSPNNDGRHDFLKFQDLDFFVSNEVFIYDKIGRLVYSQVDYDNTDTSRRFEGFNDDGNEVPNGTYYYVLILRSDRGNEYKHSGFFLINR